MAWALVYAVGIAIFVSLLAWSSSGGHWIAYAAVVATIAAIRQVLANRKPKRP